MDRAASLAPGTGTGGQGSLHALCNNLQNAGATTYIFGLQLSTFSLCNIHTFPRIRAVKRLQGNLCDLTGLILRKGGLHGAEQWIWTNGLLGFSTRNNHRE